MFPLFIVRQKKNYLFECNLVVTLRSIVFKIKAKKEKDNKKATKRKRNSNRKM